MMKTALEIFNLLNEVDEQTNIEAKPGTGTSHSVMETVCAFANEPGLNGGYILLGAVRDEQSLFPQYIVHEIIDPDKLQSDFVTQCASMFNIPIRPYISIEKINGKNVAVVKVNELSKGQKPLYFKSDGLPQGAYRRIGPTDHRCTEDDMSVFYSDVTSYDQALLDNTSLNDIDETAITRYRNLRNKINPAAEELTYNDKELLESLGCIAMDGSQRLTTAGLLTFGRSASLRRIYPMIRVDYIRVQGNTWIENPDERFATIDMRGPLLLVLFRIIDAIYSDLPKGFKLEEKELQADSIGLPVKALREAVTNALMHRSYKVNAPTQIIRYDNRLEIINPGFSLKSEDKLGKPGSESRNPFIAAIFHETNLAETKGSGIRAMRALLKKAKLAPPTFESDRDNNRFTARLLLHHFLNDQDLKWLMNFQDLDLSDHQQQALIFVREVGAIDNNTYRQISDFDTYKASTELKFLRSHNLLAQKGKGRGTYYVEGIALNPNVKDISTEVIIFNTEPASLITEATSAITEPQASTTKPNPVVRGNQVGLPKSINQILMSIGKRVTDKEKVNQFILKLCQWKPHKLSQIAQYLNKGDNHVSREYIKPLLDSKKLSYTIPEMINHPDQAYTVITQESRNKV